LYPYKNTRQFANDLDYLLRNFKPIEPAELSHYLDQHHQLPKRRFLLTFDDGFRECYEVIAPMLKAKGVPAIFFINPAYIDNKEIFYRNKISLLLGILKSRTEDKALLSEIASKLGVHTERYEELRASLLNTDQQSKYKLDIISELLEFSFTDYLERNRPWMTRQELSNLAGMGFTIGGHSWDHPYYQKISAAEQIDQTMSSIDYCRQYTSEPITFSFPHSDAALQQPLFDQLLGAENGIDLLFGIQNQKKELQNKMIHRFNAERSSVPFDQQVKGLLTYSLFRKLLHKETINRTYA
jgi:peptidoglycan/xylan/chitin deacetylase (PgdA/CDA1 family)